MIQINAPREHTFAEPLGLLSDCHRRIEKFLEQLLRVTRAAGGGVLSPEQREALAVALRYFRRAAPMHTADEEDSLFPRLRELAQGGNATAQHALATMERLESDHDAADVRHAVIDELGARWLEQSTLSAEETARLESELRALRLFYEAHIEVEDHELFPLAAGVLDAAQVEATGREMAARRGVDFNAPDAMQRCASRRKAAESS
jgi:hemerythrin-like domain-containing protein